MRLAYEDQWCKLYHGDVTDYDWSDEFHCVITDPPYGINYVSNHRQRQDGVAQAIQGDDRFMETLISWVAHKTFQALPTGSASYWFMREDKMPQLRQALQSAGYDVGVSLFWDKGNWGMGDLEGSYAPQVEMIAYATKGRHILNEGRSPNLLRFGRVPPDQLLHSCEKPESLLGFLVGKSTRAGQTVIDPFAGSGSTLCAARRLGRKAIGIEIEGSHCDVAIRRLRQSPLPLEW